MKEVAKLMDEYIQLQKESAEASAKVSAKFMEAHQFSPIKKGEKIKRQDDEFIVELIEPHLHTWCTPKVLSFTYQGLKIKKDGTPSAVRQSIHGYSQRIEICPSYPSH